MSHIFIIQNVANKEVLTWNGSSVSTHGSTTSVSKSYYNIIAPFSLAIWHSGIEATTGNSYTVLIAIASYICIHSSLADNFHVKLLGVSDQYHIQRYNNQSHKLQPANGGSEVCHQAIPTSSTTTVWVAERGPSGSSQSGVKLSTTNNSGTKWYLRALFLGGAADLVCSDHVNHVSN